MFGEGAEISRVVWDNKKYWLPDLKKNKVQNSRLFLDARKKQNDVQDYLLDN